MHQEPQQNAIQCHYKVDHTRIKYAQCDIMPKAAGLNTQPLCMSLLHAIINRPTGK